MTRIYLIRHAQAEGNLYRRVHGHYDSLVTPLGHRQIAALAERFRQIPVDACYASDLTRTRTTARAIYAAKALPLQRDARFREIGFGCWEDMTFAEMQRDYAAALDAYYNDPPNWQVPGSEPYASFVGRFLEGLQEAVEAHPNQTICIVSHGGILSCVIHNLFFQGEPYSAVGHVDNTAVCCMTWEDGRYTLVHRPDSSHLSGDLIPAPAQRSPNLWFRPLERSDRTSYLQYRQDAWTGIYHTLRGYDAEGFWLDAQYNRGADPRGLVLALQGTQAVGLVQLHPAKDAARDVGYIPFIYLAQPFRNQGLGAQLLGHATSFYRSLGRKRLQLSVSPENAQGLQFYRKHGFRQVGKIAGKFGGLYLMEQEIDLAAFAGDWPTDRPFPPQPEEASKAKAPSLWQRIKGRGSSGGS